MRDKIFQNSGPLCAAMAHPMLLLSHVHLRNNFVLYRCKIPLIDGNAKNVDGLEEAGNK